MLFSPHSTVGMRDVNVFMLRAGTECMRHNFSLYTIEKKTDKKGN